MQFILYTTRVLSGALIFVAYFNANFQNLPIVPISFLCYFDDENRFTNNIPRLGLDAAMEEFLIETRMRWEQ
jgi:hypothetical protein